MSDTTQRQVTAKLPNGATVRVAVPASQAIMAEDVGARDSVFDMDKVRDAIEGVSTMVADALKSVKPTKVSVEFGFKFEINAGHLTALFVQGNLDADLKISLEWSTAGQPS